MKRRCEICGRIDELPENQEAGAEVKEKLYICATCREERKKSLGKVITQ